MQHGPTRQGVRVADLPAAGAEEAHEGQAAHACRALCRARVAEELQRRRGTRILALSIIDRQQEALREQGASP